MFKKLKNIRATDQPGLPGVMNTDELLTETHLRTGQHAAFVREWVRQVADTVKWLRTEAAKQGIAGSNRNARRHQHKLGQQSCSEKVLEDEIPMKEYNIAEGRLIEFQASAEWLRATQGLTCFGMYPYSSREDPPSAYPWRDHPQMADMLTVSTYRDPQALDIRPSYRELSARRRNPGWIITKVNAESHVSMSRSHTDSNWCGICKDDADSASCFGSPLGTTSTCCSDWPISLSSGSPTSSSTSIPVASIYADAFSRTFPSAGFIQVPHLVDVIGHQGGLHQHVDITLQRPHQRSSFPSFAGPVAQSSEAQRTEEISKTCAFLAAQIERLMEYQSQHEEQTVQKEEGRERRANSRGAGLGECGVQSSPYHRLTQAASSPLANQWEPRIANGSTVNEVQTVEERGCRAGHGERGIQSLPYWGLTQAAGSPLANQCGPSISLDSTFKETHKLIEGLLVELECLKHKLEAG